MGAGGMIPAQADYLCFLREATRSCGALLITWGFTWQSSPETFPVGSKTHLVRVGFSI